MKQALFKAASLTFIFVMPILIILWRFRDEPVEVTRQSLGVIPSVLLLAAGIVAISFVFSIIRAKIINDPTGRVARVFYGGIMLALFGFLWSMFTSVKTMAEKQFEHFVATTQTYIDTTMYIAMSVALGLLIVLAEKITE